MHDAAAKIHPQLLVLVALLSFDFSSTTAAVSHQCNEGKCESAKLSRVAVAVAFESGSQECFQAAAAKTFSDALPPPRSS